MNESQQMHLKEDVFRRRSVCNDRRIWRVRMNYELEGKDLRARCFVFWSGCIFEDAEIEVLDLLVRLVDLLAEQLLLTRRNGLENELETRIL